MTTYLLDTNCLLSYITDRSPEQQSVISELPQDASSARCQLVVTNSVAMELVFVLRKVYARSAQETGDVLVNLSKTPGVMFLAEAGWSSVAENWPNPFRDYGDAVLATTARAHQIPVLTFDQQFRATFLKQRIGCSLLHAPRGSQ